MDVQFDKAEFRSTDGAVICAACSSPLAGAEYFDVNGQSFCASCTAEVQRTLGGKPGPSGFAKAVGGGLAGGLLGALIYYAVRAATGYEIGIIAIAVGFLVGKGVQWGTGGRGGPLYQALAIGLTYIAIVSTYVPAVIEGLRERDGDQSTASAPATPASTGSAAGAAPGGSAADAAAKPPTLVGVVVGLVLFVVLVLALPFLLGFQNIIGLIIIAIGMYEAWKINKRVPLAVTGPFGATPPAVPPPTPVLPGA